MSDLKELSHAPTLFCARWHMPPPGVQFAILPVPPALALHCCAAAAATILAPLHSHQDRAARVSGSVLAVGMGSQTIGEAETGARSCLYACHAVL